MAGYKDDIVLEITPQVLLKAYACGLFPMAESADDPGLFWLEPEQRGILPFNDFHLSKKLQRTIRRDVFEIRVSTNFQAVLNGCSAPVPGREKTWINKEIRRLYSELFEMGYCHTIEAWQDNELVGGLYGVSLNGVFFGESMFSFRSDASKTCLAHLIARLFVGGYTLLDTQFVTDHLSRLGAIEISQADYNTRLGEALQIESDFYALPTDSTGQDVLDVLAKRPPVSP